MCALPCILLMYKDNDDNTYKMLAVMSVLALCILVTGYVILCVSIVHMIPKTRVCDFTNSRPQVCFVKPSINSWEVTHNVGYFSVMIPHVEVGANMMSVYHVGDTFALTDPRVSGNSVMWTVVGCINNKTGKSEPAHFTVYHKNDPTCYANRTRDGLSWTHCR